MTTELIGLFGGLISISSALPQIYKCVSTGQTKDLSYLTYAVSYVGSFVSVYYGIVIKHDAIIACNVYSIMINTVLLSTKLYFEKIKSFTRIEETFV